jgi:hypothetical protein
MASFYPISILQSAAETPLAGDMIVGVDPVTQESKNYTISALGSMFGAAMSLLMLGAVGDGVTNDTAAVTAAEASPPYYVPRGNYLTTLAQGTLRGRWYGDGTIIDSAGNKRGRWFSAIAAAPSSFGTHTSVLTAFNGDTSKVQLLMEHRITGAATLGQPTSGYQYTPEAYPQYMFVYNEAGYNHSTSTNTGRTIAVGNHVRIVNAGQGDMAAFNAKATVSSTRSGATSFLANPAVSMMNGDLTTTVAGAYLNCLEFALDDNGFDCAGIGLVFNMARSVTTGALGEAWNGVRIQSGATGQDIDSGYFVSGPMRYGIDLVHGTFSSGAIAIKADDKIYLNATADPNTLKRYPASAGNSYIDYNSASSIIRIVSGGTASLQVKSDLVTFAVDANAASGKVYKVANTQVVGPRDTGWSAMTGSTNKATVYDTSTVTLPQLAGRMMAIQAALTTHGLLGA